MRAFNCVTSAALIPDIGYGRDQVEDADSNLLDVEFANAFSSPRSFSLDTVGSQFSFDIATVEFMEPETSSEGRNGQLSIMPSETDDLGVAAVFTFSNPVEADITIRASGVATRRKVRDGNVDYSLVWDNQEIPFGTNGSFSVDLADLSFSKAGEEIQTVTIRLLALPTVTVAALPLAFTTPEPGSLALFGIGLVGLGISMRWGHSRPRRNRGEKRTTSTA